MKLRNKNSGRIVECKDIAFVHCNVFALDYEQYIPNVHSLAELTEKWEDYTPKESLIKDEKIRKAVRAWADANGIDRCVCKDEMHCITFETERGMFISFENADPIPPEGNFAITQLCGEEEE